MHDVLEDGLSSPGKASVVMTGLVSGVAHWLQLCQDIEICSFLWKAQPVSTNHT